jgi:uncharacterized membrane protein
MTATAPGRRDDAHLRSLVKGASWRAVGTADTFLISFFVTGEPFKAGSIAGIETFTKIALFYLHERLWGVIPFGRTGEAHWRSFTKAVSWRLIGSLDTFIISFFVTGELRYAVSIASIEALTKIILYYFHERVWRVIAWGRADTVIAPALAAGAPAATPPANDVAA